MKKKFNIIDFLIVIVLIVAIVGGAVLLKDFGKEESEINTKIVTIEATELRKSLCDAVFVGDIASNGEQNTELGTVVDFEVSPCQKERFSELTGEVKLVSVPERYTLKIDIQVPENLKINVGEQIWVATTAYKCRGYVVGVGDKEGE